MYGFINQTIYLETDHISISFLTIPPYFSCRPCAFVMTCWLLHSCVGLNRNSLFFVYLTIWFAGGLEPIPAVIGRKAGRTLDRSPVHHRATQRQKTTHTLTLTPRDNSETPINLTCMFLDGGRKPEYPERTHAFTGRTYKLHTERPQLIRFSTSFK